MTATKSKPKGPGVRVVMDFPETVKPLKFDLELHSLGAVPIEKVSMVYKKAEWARVHTEYNAKSGETISDEWIIEDRDESWVPFRLMSRRVDNVEMSLPVRPKGMEDVAV
jgi:hypothetical protein